MFRRAVVPAFVFMMALAVSLAPAFAQVQRGSILVKTVDASKAVIPGVSITLTSDILPGAITGITDEFGAYRSPSLAVGTYTVTTSLPGFQTIKRENVVVNQGQTVSLDIEM